LYFRTTVYDEVYSLDSFQPWLGMVENFPVEVIDSAWKEIPSSWVASDEEALVTLLQTLYERRRRVAGLIEDMRRKRTTAFANWR
jgi:hypothetical protein